MKITFLVSGNIRSNFSYRALALAKALRARGHDITIIAPSADKYNSFVPEKISVLHGVKILQPFQFKTKRMAFNLLPYLVGAAHMVLRERSDLIYIYKPTPITVVGLLAKFFHHTPVVLDMDDLGSEVMKIEGHPAYQRKLVAWCERMTANHADQIVAASTYLRDIYQKQFPHKPIHLMPNGVDEDWFGPVVASDVKKRVVFMGAINRRTVLEPLFDIMPNIVAHHPDATLLIIGDGKELHYFKEKIKNTPFEKNVIFTGWLDINTARTHLRAGDIGYAYMPDEPTIRAASNMKVPQYMARGVVPLVSNVGDLPATVDFGTAGYVAQIDDPSELQMTLLSALNDPSRAEKAERTRAYALKEFNWNTLARDLDMWLGGNRASRQESGRKKIYFVSITVPGNIGGGEIRNYNLIRQLVKQTGADLETFCISSTDPTAAEGKFEASVNARCHAVPAGTRSTMNMVWAIFRNHVPPFMEDFKSSGLGDVFRAACEHAMPDIVQIEQLQSYYCIREHIAWLKHNGVRIVFDCHNIEFQSFHDSLALFSLPKKIVGKYLTPYLKKMEIEAATQTDLVLTCSSYDAEYFKQYNPKTCVIPNGVDCSEFKPAEKTSNPTLVFMGSVGYPPNGDAMEFYMKSIHPLVKEEIPDVELLAIGTNTAWLASLGISDPTINALGFVESVQPYLAKSAVGICPVRYGSGTRLKILAYLAAGLPVVSTHKGAEGVVYVDGRDIIFADEPRSFADAVIGFLKDKTRRETFGRNGREFVLNHYDWDIIGKQLTDAYNHEL